MKWLCHLLMRWSQGDTALSAPGKQTVMCWEGRMLQVSPWAIHPRKLSCQQSLWLAAGIAPAKVTLQACLSGLDTSLSQLFPQISCLCKGQFVCSDGHLRSSSPLSVCREGLKSSCAFWRHSISLRGSYAQNHLLKLPHYWPNNPKLDTQETQQFSRKSVSASGFKVIWECHLSGPVLVRGHSPTKSTKSLKFISLCVSPCSPRCRYCAYTLQLLWTWDFVLIRSIFLSKGKHNKQVPNLLVMLGIVCACVDCCPS